VQLFTVEEARSALARLRPVLVELSEVAAKLRDFQRVVSASARGSSADGHALADPWSGGGDDPGHELGTRMQQLLQRCNDAGVEVKDPIRALIDFRHEREGRVVYLCYYLEEPDIAFWHPIETGFAGRQPL
jgi:hypothetical protein